MGFWKEHPAQMDWRLCNIFAVLPKRLGVKEYSLILVYHTVNHATNWAQPSFLNSHPPLPNNKPTTISLPWATHNSFSYIRVSDKIQTVYLDV